MSREGVISGSPSERLITFIPSRTACSIPATISGELPSSPKGPVDTVVEDADLDSLARGRQGRAPDLGRADHLRAAEEGAVVADARLHVAYARQRGDPRGGPVRRDDGEPVQHDPV